MVWNSDTSYISDPFPRNYYYSKISLKNQRPNKKLLMKKWKTMAWCDSLIPFNDIWGIFALPDSLSSCPFQLVFLNAWELFGVNQFMNSLFGGELSFGSQVWGIWELSFLVSNY